LGLNWIIRRRMELKEENGKKGKVSDE